MTQAEDNFIALFDKFLNDKVGEVSKYEYIRVVKKFMDSAKGQTTEEQFKQTLTEFLNIDNVNTYRNTLAALKKLFEFIGQPQTIESFKYKAVMPTFNIATPSLEEMLTFGKAIENKRVQAFYYLGIVSAIRPEHMLRLKKGLFDKNNNMINTWMKEFSNKNFFFSFYTQDSKAYIEKYLATITDNNVLFPIGKRYIIKQFDKASIKTGIKITPKTMRKFTTNWLRRHGMISEDVDAITSHTPQTIVAKHYMDVSRIHEEYDRAMQDIKLNL